jgi:hypothetical protein
MATLAECPICKRGQAAGCRQGSCFNALIVDLNMITPLCLVEPV